MIVRTPNFDESPWCRRERWLAGLLAELGLATVIERDLALAEAFVGCPNVGASRCADLGHTYPMAHRIIRDLTYWRVRRTWTALRRRDSLCTFSTASKGWYKTVTPQRLSERPDGSLLA